MIVNHYIISNIYWVQFSKHSSTTCFTNEETEIQAILPQSHNKSLGIEAHHRGVSLLGRRASVSLWKPEEIIRLVPETLKLANPSNALKSYLVLKFSALKMEVDPLG